MEMTPSEWAKAWVLARIEAKTAALAAGVSPSTARRILQRLKANGDFKFAANYELQAQPKGRPPIHGRYQGLRWGRRREAEPLAKKAPG